MTQRERPQAFVDAETRRIEDGAKTEAGKMVLDEKQRHFATHTERMA